MSVMLKQLMFALFIICAGCQAQQGGLAQQPASNPSAALKFSAPTGWVEEKPGSSSRVAQYKLPKVADDAEDASAIVYFFGQGQGGGAASNIERWVNQMQQSDGSASKDKAKEESLTIHS